MNESNFKKGIIIANILFLLVLFFYALPHAVELADPVAISLAGFANPISSAWATDVLATWTILAFWIIYEARHYNVKYGWVCILLGVFPGVAFGFCLYLLLRLRQINIQAES